MIVVDILLATICFVNQGVNECHPVLVGKDTPKGEFVVNRWITQTPGYGGDVLEFHATKTGIYSIHRVYLLNPKEDRANRLKSNDPKVRKITNGCINVDPKVYDILMDCCSRNHPLLVK